jgi:hypothetical protein
MDGLTLFHCHQHVAEPSEHVGADRLALERARRSLVEDRPLGGPEVT